MAAGGKRARRQRIAVIALLAAFLAAMAVLAVLHGREVRPRRQVRVRADGAGDANECFT